MKRVVLALGVLAGLPVIFYAGLFAAAELYTEIVVLRTAGADGALHETRVTVVDIADSTWVRGRPHRGWFRRIEANAFAELFRGGVWQPVRAVVSRDPADATAFEQVMRDRYGLMYRFFDSVARMSANEIPVRLEPRAP
jgi:hypothetical protein